MAVNYWSPDHPEWDHLVGHLLGLHLPDHIYLHVGDLVPVLVDIAVEYQEDDVT